MPNTYKRYKSPLRQYKEETVRRGSERLKQQLRNIPTIRQQQAYDFERSGSNLDINTPDYTYESPNLEPTDYNSSNTSSGNERTFWSDTKDMFRTITKKALEGFVSNDADEIRRITEENEDLKKIEEYRELCKQLVEERQNYENLMKGNPFNSDIQAQLNKINNIKSQIDSYDKYFKGEGRTHDVIAQEMYDPEKADYMDYGAMFYNQLFDNTMKREDVTGNGLKDLFNLAMSGFTVTGNLFKMGADYITKGLSSIGFGDMDYGYLTKEAIKKDRGTSLVDNLYKTPYEIVNEANRYDNIRSGRGDGMLPKTNTPNFAEADPIKLWRQYNDEQIKEKTLDLQASVERYKSGKIKIPFIDSYIDIYDPEKINPEYAKMQEEHAGEFWHPMYALPEIGSTMGLAAGQGMSIIGDAVAFMLMKKLPVWLTKFTKYGEISNAVKKSLEAGDIANAMKYTNSLNKWETGISAAQGAIQTANIGNALYWTQYSRIQETAQEAMGAYSARQLQEVTKKGADMHKVFTNGIKYLNSIGINTDGLDEDKLMQLMLAYNVDTEDPIFEAQKKESRKGLNKVINDNMSLAYMDYLETLPFLSYGGSVFKSFGNGLKKGTERIAARLDGSGAAEQGLRSIQNARKLSRGGMLGTPIGDYTYTNVKGLFGNLLNKTAKKFAEKDLPRLALVTKHTGETLGKALPRLMMSSGMESLEEGVQNLLQSRYQRGEYDDYNRPYTMFNVGDVLSNLQLSNTAFWDAMGLNPGDADNGSSELRKSMAIGLFTSFVFPLGVSTVTPHSTFRSSVADYFGQIKTDLTLNKLIGDSYGNMQDSEHLGIFYDMFKKKGVNGERVVKSLNDFKSFINPDGVISKDYVDDDILLARSAWEIYKNDNIDLKALGIEKYSDKHKELVIQGAKEIADAVKSNNLSNKQHSELINANNAMHSIARELIDPETSKERKEQIRTEMPKLASIIDSFEESYKKYTIQQTRENNLKRGTTSSVLNRKNKFVEDQRIDDYIDNNKELFDEWQRFRDLESGEGRKKLFKEKLFEDETRRKQIIKDIIDNEIKSVKLTSKQDFITNQLYGYNNYMLSRKAEQLLQMMKNQVQLHKLFRDYTGADTNIDSIKGIVNEIQKLVDSLKQSEKRQLAETNKALKKAGKEEISYKTLFGDVEQELDNQQELDKIIQSMLLNRAAFNVHKIVANAFAQMEENPLLLDEAINGLNNQDPTIDFSEDKDNYSKYVKEMSSQDELERNKKLDERELKNMRKAAATKLIKKRIEEAERRRKIAHRVFEEDRPVTNDDLEDALDGNNAAQEKIINSEQQQNQQKSSVSQEEQQTQGEQKELEDKIDQSEKGKQIENNIIRQVDEATKQLDPLKQKYEGKSKRQIDAERKAREAEMKRKKSVEASAKDHKNSEDSVSQDEANKSKETKPKKESKKLDENITGISTIDDYIRKNLSNTGITWFIDKAINGDYDNKGVLFVLNVALEEGIITDQQYQDLLNFLAEFYKNKKLLNSTQEEVEETGTNENENKDEPEINPEEELQPDENANGYKEVPDEATMSDDEFVSQAEQEGLLEQTGEEGSEQQLGEEISAKEREEEINTQLILEDAENEMSKVDRDQQVLEKELQGEQERGVDIENIREIEIDDSGDITYNDTSLSEDQVFDLNLENDLLLQIDILGNYDGLVLPNRGGQTKEHSETKDDLADYVSQTFNYQPTATTPIVLKVNGQPIKLKYDLRPGQELSKKLLQKGWYNSCNKYFIITQSLQAKNVVKDSDERDSYTVAMIIEDDTEKKSYAVTLPAIGKTWSESKSGHKYIVDAEQLLRNKLEQRRVDLSRIKGNTPEQKIETITLQKARAAYIYRYNPSEEPTDDQIKKWFYTLPSKKSYRNKEDYEKALDAAKKLRQQIKDDARRSYRYANKKAPLTSDQIEAQINRLRAFRNEIIDAYLDKDPKTGKYVFPKEVKRTVKVDPNKTSISNGSFDNQRDEFDNPIFRPVATGDAQQISKDIQAGKIQFGIGRGVAIRENPFAIQREFSPSSIIYNGKGLSGKVYWMVEANTTKEDATRIPIMLTEEKFDTQETIDGKIEYISKNNPQGIKLQIDPDTGEVVGTKYKPSSAEVLLYLITGKLAASEIPGEDRKSMMAFARMFVNVDPKTIVKDSKARLFMGAFAAKQLSYENGILSIGMKNDNGNYELRTFDHNQLFGENSEETRKAVVHAIATQMHWNTDITQMSDTFDSDINSPILNALRSHFRMHGGDEVSICGLKQFTFKKSDLFDENLRFKKGVTVIGWMIANQKLKTDVNEKIFKDPFVFASGIKQSQANEELKEIKDTQQPTENPSIVDAMASQVEDKLQKDKQKKASFDEESKIKKVSEKVGTDVPIATEDTRKAVLDNFNRLPAIKEQGGALDIFALNYTDEDVRELEQKNGIADTEDIKEEITNRVKSLIDEYNAKNGTDYKHENIKFDATFNSFSKFIRQGKTVPRIIFLGNGTVQVQVPSKVSKGSWKVGVTGVYSILKTGGTVDVEGTRKWIMDTLGLDEDKIIVANGVMRSVDGKEVFGLTRLCADVLTNELAPSIMFSKKAGFGIGYHEAWHYVNLLLHDTAQRDRLYEKYRKLHPELKDAPEKDVEEALAEDFRMYMEPRSDKSTFGKIKTFFRDMRDFILSLMNRYEHLRIYRNIRKGKYKGLELDEVSKRKFIERYKGEIAKYSVSGISREVIDNMPHIDSYRQFFEVGNAIANRILEAYDPRTIKEIRKLVNSNKGFDEVLEFVKSFAEEQEDPDNYDAIMDMHDNPAAFQKILINKFREYGIIAKVKKLKQVKDGNDINIEEKENISALDKENNPENPWDKFDLSISKKDNAALRTKMFVSRIPIYDVSPSSTGKLVYELQVDRFGNNVYTPLQQAWTQLLEEFWNCESFDKVNDDGTYDQYSLMGICERLSRSNKFFYSVLQQFKSIIDSNDIELKSQIFSTFNSSKPEIAFYSIKDPVKYSTKADMLMLDVPDFDPLISDSSSESRIKDVDRKWELYASNALRAAFSIPRKWSSNILLNGLQKGDTLNADFIKLITEKHTSILSKIKDLTSTKGKRVTDDYIKSKLSSLREQMKELLNIMGVTCDEETLQFYAANKFNKGEITPSEEVEAYAELFVNKSKLHNFGDIIRILNNSLDEDVLKTHMFKGEKPYSDLYKRYKLDAVITKFALAYNSVHPSAQDFTVRGPNGDMHYPVSNNNFNTDVVRWLNQDEQYVEKMIKTTYGAHSILLEKAYSFDENTPEQKKVKLMAFIGIQDGNEQKGADYFGITMMEDFISKMFMTENDTIILPTMADKKTWYGLKADGLKLSHDVILNTVPKKLIDNEILTYYINNVAETPRPDSNDEQYVGDFKKYLEDATKWDRNYYAWKHETLESKNKDEELYRQLVANADLEARNRGIRYNRFSNETLSRFAGYFLDEINSLIAYYSEKNIQELINNPNLLIENYHGDIVDGRLDFSGNGGLFRYLYDIIPGINLNQRLQFLYELQRKIEKGVEIDNYKEGDPIKYVKKTVLREDVENLDGFELIRKELKDLKEKFFGKDGITYSEQLLDLLNNKLMSIVDDQMRELSQNEDLRLLRYDNIGQTYDSRAIPEELIDKYRKLIQDQYKGFIGEGSYEEKTQAILSLIANHTINSITGIIEYEKVASGDPAFYKYKKLSEEYETTNLTQTIKFEDGTSVTQTIPVDNIGDKYSDKIKRAGGTNSPGAEVRLYYSETEKELERTLYGKDTLNSTNYTNLNVEDVNATSALLESIERTMTMNALADIIRTKNPESFQEYLEEQQKKHSDITRERIIAQMYAGKNNYAIYHTLYDIITKDEDIKKIIDNVVSSQTAPYKKINVADAQVFIRPELYRKIRIGLGEWSFEEDEDGYSDEKAYNLIEKDASWMFDENKSKIVRKLQLYPLKMSYFQNEATDLTKYDNHAKPIYNKQAIFPWFKYQAGYSEDGNDIGSRMYRRMNKEGNEIDMISFKSAVKVGATKKALSFMNRNSTSPEQQLDVMSSDFEKDSDKSVNYKTDEVVTKSGDTLPVKVENLKYLRMQLNTHAHESESRSLGTQMFKIAFSNIFDDVYYGSSIKGKQTRLGGVIRQDIMNCVKAMTKVGDLSIKNQFYKNGKVNERAVQRFVQTIAKNNGLGSSAEEILSDGNTISSLMSRTVFENSVSSVVNGEVIEINTNGGTAVQTSTVGFVDIDQEKTRLWDDKHYLKYNNGEELKWHTEDGCSEIILSANFFKSIVPLEHQGTYQEMRQWLLDNNIIGANSKPLGIGYRIPTQGMSSMFGFRVMDILPFQSGDLIVVPREFTSQTGSDFDVDKIYIAMKSYTNGVVDSLDIDNWSNIDNIIKEYLKNNKLQELNRGLANRLIDNYLDIVTDIQNYSDARGSIDVITEKIKSELVSRIDKGRVKYIGGMEELTPTFQAGRKAEFIVGKDGIGPFALNVTNLALTQLTHLSMDYEENIFGFGALDETYEQGGNGYRISAWLSAMVNAHVDVAKDPYVKIINVNQFTYNHCNFLLRAGKGMSTFTFLAQPILKTYASRVNNSGGIYGNNLDSNSSNKKGLKSKQLSIYKQLKDEYLAVIEKLLTKENVSKLDDQTVKYMNEFLAYIKKGGQISKENMREVFNQELALEAIDNHKNANDLSLALKSAVFQLKCLKAYEMIDKYAQKISDLVTISQVDTEKFGNSIPLHINFLNNYEQFKNTEEGWILTKKPDNKKKSTDKNKQDKKEKNSKQRDSQEALYYYFSKTYLDEKLYTATRLVKDILSSQSYVATSTFNNLFKSLMAFIKGEVVYTANGTKRIGYNKVKDKEFISDIASYIDNIMRFNVFMNNGYDIYKRITEIPFEFGFNVTEINNGLPPLKKAGTKYYSSLLGGYLYTGPIDFTCGGNIDNVIDNIKRILFGNETEDSIFTRLQNFMVNILNNPDSSYAEDLVEDGKIVNELLNYLSPQSPTKEYPVGRMLLTTSQMNTDQDTKQILISAFDQLLDHNDPNVRRLARDLAFYAYYSQYDQNTVNSFFDLVPPYYRKQYDIALKKGLQKGSEKLNRSLFTNNQLVTLFDIQDEVEGNNKTSLGNLTQTYMDIIARNYWYNDKIVPIHNLTNKSSSLSNEFCELSIGSSRPKGYTNSFPGAILTTARFQQEPYIKVRKGSEYVLYKRIGIIERRQQSKKDSGKTVKFGDPVSIYIAIPKAGIRKGRDSQFELYASYGYNSIFESNKIPAKWNPNLLMKEIEDRVQKIGGDVVESKISTFIHIPAIYDSSNADMYASNEEYAINRNDDGSVLIRIGRKDEKTQIKEHDVIIDLSSKESMTPNKALDEKRINVDDLDKISEIETVQKHIFSKKDVDVLTDERIVDQNLAERANNAVQIIQSSTLTHSPISIYFRGNIYDRITQTQVEQERNRLEEVLSIPYRLNISQELKQEFDSQEVIDASIQMMRRMYGEDYILNKAYQNLANLYMNDLIQKLLLKGIRIKSVSSFGVGPLSIAVGNAIVENREYFSDQVGYIYVTNKFMSDNTSEVQELMDNVSSYNHEVLSNESQSDSINEMSNNIKNVFDTLREVHKYLKDLTSKVVKDTEEQMNNALSNLEEMETEVKGRLFSEAFEAEEFPIVEEKKATLGGLFGSKAEVDDILFDDSESYIEEEALEQSENKDNSNSKKC